ncbi:MAG: hypothetical protein ACPLYF_05055, partial [Fervidobacterium sp.]
AGEHPWVKFEVQKVEGTKVTVLWTTGGPSGVSVPSGMPTYGLTVSWDVASGGGAFSYFIIHANAKVGDSVNVMGLLQLQIQGETTRTYAGASRKVVYASYSSFGLQNFYYWDKETGVLLEYSWTMGGVELTMKAVETNLWQSGIGGIPLWILGVIVALIAAVTIIIVAFWRKRPSMREQSSAQDLSKREISIRLINNSSQQYLISGLGGDGTCSGLRALRARDVI